MHDHRFCYIVLFICFSFSFFFLFKKSSPIVTLVIPWSSTLLNGFAAKSEVAQLKKDIGEMAKAKGEICSQILENQRKIASLECDSSTLSQVEDFGLTWLHFCFLFFIFINEINGKIYFKKFLEKILLLFSFKKKKKIMKTKVFANQALRWKFEHSPIIPEINLLMTTEIGYLINFNNK